MWQHLVTEDALEKILARSYEVPQLIFKHSTRCTISESALGRVNASLADLAKVYELHLLDLIQYRAVSNLVAELLAVPHESPQVLVVSKGECIYDWSHFEIEPDKILAAFVIK